MQCHQHRCLFILFDAKQTIQTYPNFSELLFLGTASCFRLRFGSWLFFFLFLANTGERIDDCIAPPRASNKKTMRQHQSQATDCQRSLLRLCSALCFCLAKFADGHVIQYLLTSVSLSLACPKHVTAAEIELLMPVKIHDIKCTCRLRFKSVASTESYGRCQVYKGNKGVCTTSKVSSSFASQPKGPRKAEACSNLPTANQ